MGRDSNAVERVVASLCQGPRCILDLGCCLCRVCITMTLSSREFPSGAPFSKDVWVCSVMASVKIVLSLLEVDAKVR